MLPYGESIELNICETKVYCPLCKGLFVPDYEAHRKFDGAAFGPSFAHVLILENKEQFMLKQHSAFANSLHGFKLSSTKDFKDSLKKVQIQRTNLLFKPMK